MSGAITQTGPVVPGHVPAFAANGIVQDGGPASGGVISEIGITNDGGLAIGVNSGTIAGEYTQFGVTVVDGAVTLSANSFNGASAASVVWNINGTNYPLNPSGNGNITGPGTSVSGDLLSFNGANGNLAQDSGIAQANVVQNAGGTVAAGNLPSFNGVGGRELQDSGIATTNVMQNTATAVTAGDLPSFNGVGGRELQDSGLVAANVVQNGTTAVAGNIAVFDGATGKLIEDGGFTVSAAMKPVVTAGTVGTALALLAVQSGATIVAGAKVNGATTDATVEISGLYAISAEPSYTGSVGSYASAFVGDFSNTPSWWGLNLTGTATGTASADFVQNPNWSGMFGYLSSSSGWMQELDGSGGASGIGAIYLRCDNLGQGNVTPFFANTVVDSALAGATNWAAYPSGGVLAGQVSAGRDNVNIGMIEVHSLDSGYNAVCIGINSILYRDNNTAPLGEPWVGLRVQSQGTLAPDAVLNPAGSFVRGTDFTSCAFSSNAAVSLKESQRIYLNSTNSGEFSNTTSNGTAFIYADSSGTLWLSAAGNNIELGSGGVQFAETITTSGNMNAGADNTYNVGESGARWATGYFANGVVTTSDPDEKTAMAPLPSVASLFAGPNALNPIVYKWIVGGYTEVETQEVQTVQDTEEKTVPTQTIEIQNGKPVLVAGTRTIQEPLYDRVPVLDAAGKPVIVKGRRLRDVVLKSGKVVRGKTYPDRPMMHSVPRMVSKPVPVKKMVPRAGERLHWGFDASKVKPAFDSLGLDFGGYVKGADGRLHLRKDEFIPVVWKRAQELTDENIALRADNTALWKAVRDLTAEVATLKAARA